jgi:hypothetical protein
MSDETTSRGQDPFSRAGGSLHGVFTTQATAVAAAVLAFVTLTGNSILVAGLQAVLGQGVGANVGPFGYLMSQAVACLALSVLVVVLARPGLRQGTGWESHTARAAVILAGLALAGALLMLVGGLFTEAGLLPI